MISVADFFVLLFAFTCGNNRSHYVVWVLGVGGFLCLFLYWNYSWGVSSYILTFCCGGLCGGARFFSSAVLLSLYDFLVRSGSYCAPLSSVTPLHRHYEGLPFRLSRVGRCISFHSFTVMLVLGCWVV